MSSWKGSGFSVITLIPIIIILEAVVVAESKVSHIYSLVVQYCQYCLSVAKANVLGYLIQCTSVQVDKICVTFAELPGCTVQMYLPTIQKFLWQYIQQKCLSERLVRDHVFNSLAHTIFCNFVSDHMI